MEKPQDSETNENKAVEKEPQKMSAEPETMEAGTEELSTPEAEVVPTEVLKEEMANLRESLAKAEDKAAEYLDSWQRSQASYQNYRKRIEAEKREWQANANAALLTLLLGVMDDFERAFSDQPEEIKDSPWIKGVELVKQKLHHIFEIENVKPIEVKPGDEFDPYYHEAILCQESPDFEDDQIMVEAQRGYMQGERVLRPAKVVVAKATKPCKAVEHAQESEAATDEDK